MTDRTPLNIKQFKEIALLLEKMELPLFIGCIIGLILKISHLPGANMLLLLSLGTSSMAYIFGILVSKEGVEVTGIEKILLKMFGLGCSTGTMGILFFLLRWPGGKIMLMMSSVALMALLLYAIVSGKPKLSGSRLLYRLVIILGLGLFLLASSMLHLD